MLSLALPFSSTVAVGATDRGRGVFADERSDADDTRTASPDAAPFAPVTPAAVERLVARARALGLADERSWRRLLHYHPTALGRGGLVSHVDDPRFFLAGESGRRDATAELDATIATLFGGAGAEADAARCRFVARDRWLRERLAGEVDLPPETPRCSNFRDWHATLGARSVTLIFPAAYLNNPSSMFGHTLLRLDPAGVDAGSDWLSWSLNFAADVGTDTPRTATYAWKGITGGYPGRFELEPYFKKIRQYGAIENRDIWEYRLDLAPEEVERLVEHVWELRGIVFDYFFFRENCSYRLLELIDLARPTLDLAARFRFTAIPSDTVRAVAEAGLVESARWLPSAASRLRHESAAVPVAARTWIDALARDPARADDARFRALEPARQRDAVLAANRLMTYRARREPPSSEAAERRLAMLSLLSGYPAAEPPAPPPPLPPERGHDSSLATLGIVHERARGGRDGNGGGGADEVDANENDDRDGTHLELGLRASYHDLLDAPAGYLTGSAISLGELRLRTVDGEGLRLESFDIVRIRSLGAPVPFLPTPSWGVDVALARDPDVEGGRLGLRVGGLVGLSRAFGEGRPALVYALAGPAARLFARADESPGRTRLDGVVRLGALRHGAFGGSRVELGLDALAGRAPRFSLALAHDLPLSRNRALRARIDLSRLDGEEALGASLDYRLHF